VHRSVHLVSNTMADWKKTVFFGANDACLPNSDTKQHVPLEEYVKNLGNIVSHPKIKAQAPRIIVITPPPICEYAQEAADNSKGAPLRRRAEVTKAYATAAKSVAEEHGLGVVDMWALCMKKTGWTDGKPLPGSKSQPRSEVLDKLLYDGEGYNSIYNQQKLIFLGLHLAPDGYRVLYDGLMEVIQNKWPDQMPSELSPVLPNWDDQQAWV
jgi:isoamyl acetate esterase